MRPSSVPVPLALLSLLACSDVSSLRLNLAFEDPEVEAQTQALDIAVTEVPTGGEAVACQNPCIDARRDPPLSTEPGLNLNPPPPPEQIGFVPYPLTDDVSAIDVGLAGLDELVLVVRAFPSIPLDTVAPLACSCQVVDTTATDAIEVDVLLETQ
jgi:hypothetical protein